jgi:ornithine carbamoyltransferase
VRPIAAGAKLKAEASMAVDLKGRSFLKLLDFTTQEIRELLTLAAELKVKKRAGIRD